MNKILDILKNESFRAGISLVTLGVGAFLFFKDFRKWLNNKLDTNKNVGLVRLMATGSILDNGIGMVWSRFAKGHSGSWMDHATATAV